MGREAYERTVARLMRKTEGASEESVRRQVAEVAQRQENRGERSRHGSKPAKQRHEFRIRKKV